MSAIRFNCPNCGALIAFDSKHSGKRARCLSCGQAFVIPQRNHEKAERVEAEAKRDKPLPGFYRAVFIESWKLFANSENVTSLAFIVTVVGLKFFFSKAVCCMNYVSSAVVWGWLLGFYLNIIYKTAFDSDELPKIYLGTSITFLWEIIRPFLIFFFTLFVVLLPFIIALSIFNSKGLVNLEALNRVGDLPLLLQILLMIGLFLFPMAILTTSVGRDFTMLLRPKYLLVPIFKGFVPYLIIVLLFFGACQFQVLTGPFNYSDTWKSAIQLLLHLFVQVIAIVAMRSIGLFYRHYGCYLPW